MLFRSQNILEWLAMGMSFDEIVHDFPELNKEDIVAALEFSAHRQHKTLIAA